MQGLRAGVYRLAVNNNQGVYRFWAANTAPPSAQRNVIVYTADETNGPTDDGTANSGRGTMKMFLSHPIVLAAIVATAIAVPVASERRIRAARDWPILVLLYPLAVPATTYWG